MLSPSPKQKNFSDMVLWRWYQTGEFSFTLPTSTAARADSDANYAGRLAGGLAPDDEICTTCDAGEADLEPPLTETRT